MNRDSLFLVIACVVGLSRFSCADEAYDVKWRLPRVGDVNLVRNTTILNLNLHRVTVDGKEVPLGQFGNLISKEDSQKNGTTIYRETALKTRDEFVVSLKRRYQQIESLTNEAPSKHLIDQDVIVDLDGEISCHFPDGSELRGGDEEFLREEFRMANKIADNFIYPTRPVKLGEEWSINARAIADVYKVVFASEVSIVPDQAKAAGVLKRVYRRDGIQYGEMHFKIRLPYEELSRNDEDDGDVSSGQSDPDDQPAPLSSDKAASSKKQLPKDADQKAAEPKQPQVSESRELRDLIIEIITDSPIDGSSGPTQQETLCRLIRSQRESIFKMEFEAKFTIHEKVTPLPE